MLAKAYKLGKVYEQIEVCEYIDNIEESEIDMGVRESPDDRWRSSLTEKDYDKCNIQLHANDIELMPHYDW
jgi:hypothetical protein